MNKKFERFFIENYSTIKSFAVRILISEPDAEDITQDVFVKLLDMPHVWSEKGDAHIGLLYTMTRNHIFNFLKHKSIERKYQENHFQNNSVVNELGLEKELYAKELELVALNVIENMPEQRKKIIKMSRFEGKSNQEIADLLNVSVRTVERHIYLALSELKKILLLLIF